ncbi:GntR family transcriptional regulator [Lentzea sp. JNUCC 0626]|uniref:GntR family transcriptional regulator n=1 Tax=Lentzea sp. JNUCC 0626 TaxID=3367513 RepID=UPI0037495A7E
MAIPSTGVRPIETRSVAEQVTAELRRSILCGDLEPGREFSLREIAGMLNVSFIPVREALKNLETEGLVITRPGRSALVAPLDLADLQAIYRLRRTIEPEIAGRACLLLPDAELDRLDAMAAGFGDERLGMDAIYDAHHEFHLALLAPAASAWDVRLLGTLWRAAERYIRIGFGALDPDPGEHHRREEAHGSLVDVFRRRDPEAAAVAVREHLERNEQLALRALGDGTETPPQKPSTPRKSRARRTSQD